MHVSGTLSNQHTQQTLTALGGLSSHVTILDVAEHDDVDSRSSSSASLCFRFSDDDFSHVVKDIFKIVKGCFSGESEMRHGLAFPLKVRIGQNTGGGGGDIFKIVKGCFSGWGGRERGGGGGWGGRRRSAPREATLAVQQTTTVTYYDVRCCHYSVFFICSLQ